ncbi:MATE family efflux transporter [Carnobacteriaceae bacterium zg-ZUI240]|nr:MATE family efflux transporter [Carnobacteriaceae bacterium zg-ZUI240]
MKKQTDLTHAPIMRALILFAIPIFISTIFQQLYNAADTTIVGNFLGENALAAVGSTAAVFELIVGFALGIGNGMSIVTARFFGANDLNRVRQSAAHAIMVGVGISLMVMIIGHFGLHPLLQTLHTPAEIIDQAFSYIYIILMFVSVTFAYNLGAGLLRAIGNSVVPLIILVIASVINIVLDIVFITQLHTGIQGAAYATVIAQLFSAVSCFTYIYFKAPTLLPHQNDFKIDEALLKELLAQGLSMGFMSSIVSIGSVILQTSVNQFGPLIIAAQTTARRVQFFFLMPITSFGTALTTFVSQNFGAKQYARIRKAINYAFKCSMVWGIFVALLMYVVAEPLIIFISGSTHPVLVETAKTYIFIATPLFCVLGILLCLRNSLQGLGQKIQPLISSIIELVGKILFVLLIVPHMGYLGIMLCEPIIWVVMTTQLAYSFYRNPFIRSTASKKI